ncbi:MAG TPA: sulfurtransferase [Betaproteobacteria bacterium]|nr:sulfurtransferase [Betaproteobacteria bacterium]
MGLTTLVSTETLARRLDDPAWIVFDCRFTLTNAETGRRAYASGHVPGARYAHLEEALSAPVTPASGRHPLPSPDAFADQLGRWGVNADKQVVVYDDSFGSMAVRLWWMLRWVGHESVALLDGGWPKWRREKHPVTTALPAVQPTDFPLRLAPGLQIDAGQVNTRRQDKNTLIVDARPEERFTGDYEPLDKIAGHIPGSVNWPFEENLDLGGAYLPAEELRENYLKLLHDVPPEQVIHSCGSGVTACHNVLAMEIAGLSGSQLYAGSWSEWITDPAHPVETGENGVLCV